MNTVLSVFNAYLNRGGEDGVFEAEANLLEQFGDTVIRFRVEADALAKPSLPSRIKLAANTIWSKRYYNQFIQLIEDHQPDVVHFHNTFPLISPSAYAACKSAAIPTIQTLHNYRLICPSAQLFRDGRPCNDCVGRTIPWPSIVHACYRGSRSQTSVVAAMLAAHRWRGTWDRDIDLYIALTEFSRQTLISGGLNPQKIVVKPNFVFPDPDPKSSSGEFILFVGRLASNKGIDTLLDAWNLLEHPIPLRIVGDGPLAGKVSEAARVNSAIEYLGRMSSAAVIGQMHRAVALVFPSRWFEGFPLTIAESFACALPVVASRLGSMAEIVDHRQTGLLFEPGDSSDLARSVSWLWEHQETAQLMGQTARRTYEERYSARRNYELLREIYDRALAL